MKHEPSITDVPEKQLFWRLKPVYSNETAFQVHIRVGNNSLLQSLMWAITANSYFLLSSTHMSNHMISTVIVVQVLLNFIRKSQMVQLLLLFIAHIKEN